VKIYEELLAGPSIFSYIRYMVIELKEDKLADYMSAERLLVVISVDWCGSCKKIKPKLYEIDDKFTIVIIDGERHLRSMKFLPGKTSSYPRLGYYEKGYYIGDVSQVDVHNGLKNKEI
jgi:thiol-disulfide isomerase/thioredoxin